jgi:hypothetical protein
MSPRATTRAVFTAPFESRLHAKHTSRPPASRIAARIAFAAAELSRADGSAAVEGDMAEI